MTSVDADGTPDGAPGHAAHHATGKLVIGGTDLTGASATLNGSSGEIELAICSAADDQLVVDLPDGFSPGTYTLTIANAAGSCSVTTTILQGEKGDPGSYTVGAGLQLNGDELSVNLSKARTVAITPDLFHAYDGGYYGDYFPWNSSANYTYPVTINQGYLGQGYAVIPLPDGAQLTEVKCR